MIEDAKVSFVIDITVHDVEGFKAAVERCVEISRDEPGTLLYSWYLNEETGAARLYEAYADVDAVLAHARGPVFIEVGPELIATCRFDQMDAFGDVGRLAEGEPLWPTIYWGSPFSAL